MYERKSKEVSLDEVRKSLKTIGIDMSPEACAIGLVVGNGRARFQWSELTEVEKKDVVKPVVPASPESPSVDGEPKKKGAS